MQNRTTLLFEFLWFCHLCSSLWISCLDFYLYFVFVFVEPRASALLFGSNQQPMSLFLFVFCICICWATSIRFDIWFQRTTTIGDWAPIVVARLKTHNCLSTDGHNWAQTAVLKAQPSRICNSYFCSSWSKIRMPISRKWKELLGNEFLTCILYI